MVDDDPGVVAAIDRFLEEHFGVFEVTTLTDPTAALGTVRQERLNCVVSDYDMPRMDGLELLKPLREESPDLPFVLFIGKEAEKVGPEALERGVSRYLYEGLGTAHSALLASDVAGSVETHQTSARLR